MQVEKKELKRKWTPDGNKQIINSPHKTFNAKTNVLDNAGQMFANTQICYIVRAFDDIKCNEQIFEKGQLQQFDIKYEEPQVKQFIKNYENKNASFWLSNFYIKNKFVTFLLDRTNNELFVFNYAKNYKQQNLIDWLLKYLFSKKEVKKNV